MDTELLLVDRIDVIRKTVEKYGEDNFYLSFSGGKDSTVIHCLLDLALPNNKIPRVFFNTGIEYKHIVDFVKELADKDDRFVIINSKVSIKKMLEKDGYPFKSKEHATKISMYQRGLRNRSVLEYINGNSSNFGIPTSLRYQLDERFTLKLSAKCCYRLKKEPAHKYEVESGRTIAILGLRSAEGGNRQHLTDCISYKYGKVARFSPLMKIDDEWEEWFINEYKVKLCNLYYSPFNMRRTGCKGCPFALELQDELDVMQKYLPNEAKQCEILWKPVYDEYRRIGYRLRKKGLF